MDFLALYETRIAADAPPAIKLAISPTGFYALYTFIANQYQMDVLVAVDWQSFVEIDLLYAISIS